MKFKLFIRLVNKKYEIVAEGSLHEWMLFKHKDWDTITAQRDYLCTLFGYTENVELR